MEASFIEIYNNQLRQVLAQLFNRRSLDSQRCSSFTSALLLTLMFQAKVRVSQGFKWSSLAARPCPCIDGAYFLTQRSDLVAWMRCAPHRMPRRL